MMERAAGPQNICFFSQRCLLIAVPNQLHSSKMRLLRLYMSSLCNYRGTLVSHPSYWSLTSVHSQNYWLCACLESTFSNCKINGFTPIMCTSQMPSSFFLHKKGREKKKSHIRRHKEKYISRLNFIFSETICDSKGLEPAELCTKKT